jgi:hypothetical protein
MRRQPLRLRALLDFLLYRLAQLGDRGIQPIEQLQQLVPPPVRPRSQSKRFQSLPLASPQPLLAAQTFVQRNRLQLIHDPGAGLHHAVAMP